MSSGGGWRVGFSADRFGFALDAALWAIVFALVLSSVRRLGTSRGRRPTLSLMLSSARRSIEAFPTWVPIAAVACAYYAYHWWLPTLSVAIGVATAISATLVSWGRLLRVTVALSLLVATRGFVGDHANVVTRPLPGGGALYQCTYRPNYYPVERLFLRPAWSLALVPLGEIPSAFRCPSDVEEATGPGGERVIVLEQRIAPDEPAGCRVAGSGQPEYVAFVGRPILLGTRWHRTYRRFRTEGVPS